MAFTEQQKKEDEAAFAEQFGKEEAQKPTMSEDEAFGLGPDAGAAPSGDAAAAASTTDAGPVAAEPGAAPDTAAAPSPAAPAAQDDAAAATEQRLRSWEGRLKAKEAELAAQAAAMAASNTNEQQTSAPPAGDDKSGDADDQGEQDPAKAIAADFGEEFVGQLRKLIEQVCCKQVGDGIGGISDTVQSVIDHLQQKDTDSHFKAIRAAHEDFMEIIDSPEFGAWRAAQPPDKKAELQRVIDAGSAEEIIAMLTEFKRSKSADAGADDQALDAAEGVRSSGLSLPKEPPSSNDFAAAWNES